MPRRSTSAVRFLQKENRTAKRPCNTVGSTGLEYQNTNLQTQRNTTLICLTFMSARVLAITRALDRRVATLTSGCCGSQHRRLLLSLTTRTYLCWKVSPVRQTIGNGGTATGDVANGPRGANSWVTLVVVEVPLELRW